MRDALDRSVRRDAEAQARERWIAAGLFAATCASVFVVRVIREAPDGLGGAIEAGFGALAFTVGLMTILLAHELGHVAGANSKGITLSWPWFLPAPFLVGTFGAVMRLDHPPRDRDGLIAMAAPGPIAGFVAACVVFGLHLAFDGDPTGEPLAAPLAWQLPMALGWTGAPSTGQPLGFAAWLGFLLTGMNLLPLGQLDGGHLAYGVAPGAVRVITAVTVAVLLVLGLGWPLWGVWVGALALLRALSPAEVRQPGRPIGRDSVAWVVAAALCWILSFLPIPA